MHFFVQLLMSLAIPSHKKQAVISQREAQIPRCPRERVWRKIDLRKEREMSGRKVLVEVSPRKGRLGGKVGLRYVEKGKLFERRN
jgi:hypothetical protein